MTPAIKQAQKAGINVDVLPYRHDPDCTDFGDEVVRELGRPAEQVFKTLIVDLGGKLAMALVPVSHTLCLKALARAAKVKKAQMADIPSAERATGYIKGGISPLGQKKRLPAFIDSSAEQLDTLIVSAGRRGLQLELCPADLARLLGAHFATLRSE